VRVFTRAANEAALLADLSFQPEPLPLLRPEGSELPWLIEGPGSSTDATQGRGTWELLLQRARGRWLQVRLSLEGNELATPRLAALRAWNPRFSYSQRYLPAVYREDAGSADFLERFLANFEGTFTQLEDRIAAASALFDVRSAPADTLDWLAGWLGLVLDPSMDERRRRQLIRNAVALYQYRGTTASMRLAVQLALSDCVPDEDFVLPSPSQEQPWGVRVIEGFLTRLLPPALLGETTFDDTPRMVTPGARWSPAEGADGLHRRWRAWLAAAGKADETALFKPLAPSAALAADWQAFCQSALGVVPQLAQAFDAAWQGFVSSHPGLRLGNTLPANGPTGTDDVALAQQREWREFLASLGGRLRRWVKRWQAFVARRHLRVADYKVDTGLDWPEFELLPVPTTLPANTSALADWFLFETRLEPMAAAAHAFSVLLPIAGPQADAAALAQRIDLATRIVRLEKPAHTRFDVRPYWALFRIGQVRLGWDTLLGDGSREPGLAPAMVLGLGHIGAARVALRPEVPDDRILLEC
jgi:phage tail-like protein